MCCPYAGSEIYGESASRLYWEIEHLPTWFGLMIATAKAGSGIRNYSVRRNKDTRQHCRSLRLYRQREESRWRARLTNSVCVVQ